jgi:hypothetical protein
MKNRNILLKTRDAPVMIQGNTGYWFKSLYVRPLIVLSVMMYSKFEISRFLHRSEIKREEREERKKEERLKIQIKKDEWRM